MSVLWKCAIVLKPSEICSFCSWAMAQKQNELQHIFHHFSFCCWSAAWRTYRQCSGTTTATGWANWGGPSPERWTEIAQAEIVWFLKKNLPYVAKKMSSQSHEVVSQVCWGPIVPHILSSVGSTVLHWNRGESPLRDPSMWLSTCKMCRLSSITTVARVCCLRLEIPTVSAAASVELNLPDFRTSTVRGSTITLVSHLRVTDISKMLRGFAQICNRQISRVEPRQRRESCIAVSQAAPWDWILSREEDFCLTRASAGSLIRPRFN